MSDPLSIAGSAAGLVSLGLQVYGGITQYLDALSCRDEDIASARAQNNCLRETLQVVEALLAQLQCNRQATIAVSPVRSCLDSCQRELQALDALIANLAGSAQPAAGRITKFRNNGKKLLYPFSRPKLQQLETKMQSANATLQLALQVLGLSVSQLGVDRLATLGFDLRLQSTSLGLNLSASIHNSLNTRLDRLEDNLEAKLDDKLGQLVSQLYLTRGPQEVTPEMATRRLLGKPGVLKDLCDAASDWTRPAQPRNMTVATAYPGERVRGRFACCCRSRRLLQRKDMTWASLSFFAETDAEQHLAGCPAARGVIEADRSRKVGVTYTGLRHLLNWAVQISFVMRSGAGGLSFSPSLTFYPTVRADSAPAFLILELLNYAGRHPYNFDYDELAKAATATIVRLFETKKASPQAVTKYNQSLVHYLADCIYTRGVQQLGLGCNNPLLQLLKCLLAYRAPIDYTLPMFTSEGETPIARLFPSRTLYKPVSLAAAELIWDYSEVTLAYTHVPDLPSFHGPLGSIYSHPKATFEFLTYSAKLAEAYGCGPLSLAILANDQNEVERLLRTQPGTLKERNQFLQTPLHLAADKPLCLHLLVQIADPALLNEIDCEGQSALDFAIALSGAHCRTGASSRLCRRCRCAECAVMLMKARCALPLSGVLLLAFRGASQRCKRKYARHLKDRREKLRNLALANLSAPEAEQLGLLPSCGNVLDYAARRVVWILQHRLVIIPDALAVKKPGEYEWKEKEWEEEEEETPLSTVGSVYQVIVSPHGGDLFFQLGFHDTQSWWDVVAVIRCELLREMKYQVLPYMQWLSEHGADPISYPLKSLGRGLIAAHYTLWIIGLLLSDGLTFQTEKHGMTPANPSDMMEPLSPTCGGWVHEVHAAALEIIASDAHNVADNCRCWCSPDGCTPLTYLMKGLVWPMIYSNFTFSGTIRNLSRYLELFGDGLELSHHKVILRYLTYRELDAPHTCCDPEKAFERGWETKSDEETDELEEEHAHELAMLKELLDEFEPQVVEILQDRNRGIPGLIDFYEQVWLERMGEVRDSFKGNDLSDHERRGAEEIGVVWHGPEPKHKVVEESLTLTVCECVRKERHSYWMCELEKIKAKFGL